MGRVRYGLHRFLEDEANRLLAQSMSGSTRWSDNSDILTPSKESRRRSREVMVSSGTPDPSLRRGSFTRAANTVRPDLNSREGVARPERSNPGRSGLGPTAAWVDGYLGGRF